MLINAKNLLDKVKLFILFPAVLFLIPGAAQVALAAGTVVQSEAKLLPNNSGIREVTFTWTADAAAATVPDTALTADNLAVLKGLQCYFAITDPGATAPTDDYDITVIDQWGVDVFNTGLTDRDTANSEHTIPYVVTGSTTFAGITTCSGTWTIKWANNAVNSATGILVLRFMP